MDTTTIATLQDILLRESHTLLNYMSTAGPWTDSEHADNPNRLNKLAAEERAATNRLMNWLLRRKIPPLGGSYPKDFTTLHFVAMDHLLPQLVKSERRLLDQLRQDAAKIADQEPRHITDEMIEMKRRHLAELESLAAEYAGKLVSTLR